MIRYRRRAEGEPTPRITGSISLELFWTITPFFFFLAMFIWGAILFFNEARPPDNAIEIYVVGKQWMWKVQHQGGQREINSLTVPVGQPVKITITSEDVIHDFGLPEFRLKRDAIPGRYTYSWFTATRVGDYHIFCDQYCGTDHSGMVGWVHVLKPEDYETWLTNRAEGSLALQGRKLFLKLQCITCHSADSSARAPVLEGLYGRSVHLSDGRTVLADEAYIRKSILYPAADVVQGWQPIMPTFDGILAEKATSPEDRDNPLANLTQEEALIRLIAYIKSLQPNQTPNRNERFPAPVGAPTTPEQRKKGP
ncbi:MAG TPA: cytochrome c oxidase subunit II, partial [Gemmataceae bacterium]|nr:cytochrome c oxidase subunit II [Gemmataceae bacterium]